MGSDRSSEELSRTDTGQITVAELLQRNGLRAGSAAGGRRRRADSGGVSVADLTGETPKVRLDHTPPRRLDEPGSPPQDEAAAADNDGPVQAWSEAAREPELISGSTVADDLLIRAGDTVDPPQPAERSEPSAVRQWLAVAGEALVALVVGALLFEGFERLWDTLPWVALVLAVLVISTLVALVRVVRKADDILSIVIAIVVGLFVTIGPLAFLLSAS